MVVPILRSRDALPQQMAERLLDDSSATVRFEALRSLIKGGREFPDDEARSILIKPAARGGLAGIFGGYSAPLPDKESEALWERFKISSLRAQSASALEKLAASSTITDQDARFALDYKLFRTRAAALRAAIDDQFKVEFNASFQGLEKILTNAETLNRIRSLEEVLRKEMVRKGTDILCEKSEPEDLNRVRQVVSGGFAAFSQSDVRYLRKHGEWQDIALLIGLLDRSDGSYSLLGGLYDSDRTSTIAEAIHSIGKGRFSELCKLKMPVRLLARVIGVASEKEIEELSDNDLIEQFASDSDQVRKALLPRVVKALPKTRLKKLLTAYSDYDGLRYYNVFYWLDLGISLTHKQILHATEMIARKKRE